jgi:hypothetical protein
MGIRFNAVHLLAKSLAALGDLKGKTILTMGVQDCYFTYDEIVDFLRRHHIVHTPVPANEILLTTGFASADSSRAESHRHFIHQRTLFRLLGFGPDHIHSMDHSSFEGADSIQDLNLPVPNALFSKYDLIFDGGTIEHVFSIKDALFNMSRMCKVGGVVVNFSPVDYINHGFINLNAEIFTDFFGCNDFEKIDLKYIAMPSHPKLVDKHYLEYAPESLYHSLGPYYQIGVFSAFRKSKEAPLRIPQQGFYARLWQGDSANMTADSSDSRLRPLNFLRARLSDLIGRYFISSVLFRGYRSIGRGRRVLL